MDKLVALPLRGESFLLAKGDRRVLVDGGYSSTRLSKSLRVVDPRLSHIDIVVCTHGDVDHAGGLKDFIDQSGISIGEFWLPGSWKDSVGALLYTPKTVANELVSELDAFAKELNQNNADAIYKILDERILSERQRAVGKEFRGDKGQAEALFESSGKQNADLLIVDEDARSAFDSARRRLQERRRKGSVPDTLVHYWLGLVKTADIIRSIARQAIKHRVKVRWFDFEEFSLTNRAIGGDNGYLEPLNSVEQSRLPRAGLSYLAMLSQRNQECLAFFAPSSFGELGVIFCGDSPMGYGAGYTTSFLGLRPEPSWPVVATAPHHGSDSNAIAYRHISQWADVLCWVRAGGTKRHPGKAFKSLPTEKRACTHCPQVKENPSKAEIDLSNLLVWPLILPVRIMLPRSCSC